MSANMLLLQQVLERDTKIIKKEKQTDEIDIERKLKIQLY